MSGVELAFGLIGVVTAVDVAIKYVPVTVMLKIVFTIFPYPASNTSSAFTS